MFEENPELEDLMAQNGSNEYFELSIEKPSKGESFVLKGGKITLQINGMLFTNDLTDENSISVAIYDNNPQNYKSNKSLFSFSLPLEKDTADEEEKEFGFVPKFEDAYFVNLKETIEIKAGLYYYLILQKGETAAMYTGKFEVKE